MFSGHALASCDMLNLCYEAGTYIHSRRYLVLLDARFCRLGRRWCVRAVSEVLFGGVDCWCVGWLVRWVGETPTGFPSGWLRVVGRAVSEERWIFIARHAAAGVLPLALPQDLFGFFVGGDAQRASNISYTLHLRALCRPSCWFHFVGRFVRCRVCQGGVQ